MQTAEIDQPVKSGPNRDTTAARRARTRAKHDRWATELRAAGWIVTAPEGVPGSETGRGE